MINIKNFHSSLLKIDKKSYKDTDIYYIGYIMIKTGIRSEIKTINGGKELFFLKNYSRIGINTDDDLPLNKPLKFPTLTIIIRCIFQEGEKLYPQIYLDECLYEL